MTPTPRESEIADARALVDEVEGTFGTLIKDLGPTTVTRFLIKLCTHLTRFLDQHKADVATLEAQDETIKGLRSREQYLIDLLGNTNVDPEAYEEST